MQSSRLVRRIMGALVIAASAQLLPATVGAQSCYPCGVPTVQSSPYTSYGNGGGASITSGGVGGGPSFTGGGGFVYSNGGAATYMRPPTITSGPNVAGPALPYSTGGQATYGAGYTSGSVPGYSPGPTYINRSPNPYPYSSNGYQTYTPPPTITNNQGGYTNQQVPYSPAPATATRGYTPPSITTGPSVSGATSPGYTSQSTAPTYGNPPTIRTGPDVASQPSVYFGTPPSSGTPGYTTQGERSPAYSTPSAPIQLAAPTITTGRAANGVSAATQTPDARRSTPPPTMASVLSSPTDRQFVSGLNAEQMQTLYAHTPQQIQQLQQSGQWVAAKNAIIGGVQNYGASVVTAARNGIQQTTAGLNQGRTASNPGTLLEGAVAMDAGAVNTLSAPLAPIAQPVNKAVNYVGGKIGDNAAVQRFAMSPAGTATARAAQDVQNLSTVAGGVASVSSPGAMLESRGQTVPKLPEFLPRGKTTGVLQTSAGETELISGRAGPASAMPRGSPGFDGISKTHVEGHAAALMQQKGVSDGTLYINNPKICDRCAQNLPSMLAEGSTLRVVTPDGSSQIFTGSAKR
jgi:hypothetical protein